MVESARRERRPELFLFTTTKVLKSAGKSWKVVESGRKCWKVLESSWCIKYIRLQKSRKAHQHKLICSRLTMHNSRSSCNQKISFQQKILFFKLSYKIRLAIKSLVFFFSFFFFLIYCVVFTYISHTLP